MSTKISTRILRLACAKIAPALALVLGLTAFLANEARAGLVMSVATSPVVPGQSGTLDVTLTNTGPSDVSVGSFGFELNSSSSDLTFTDATTSTAIPYIFAGNSFSDYYLSGDIAFPVVSPQTIDALDSVFTPFSYTTLTAGETVGLGHVLFDISPTAQLGPITLSFTEDISVTNVSDANSNPLDFTTSEGQLNVVVPEPASIALMLQAFLGVGYLESRKARMREGRKL